ncbi:MAG: glycosyltransferase [Oscillospiraceae bacterium]
MKIAVYAICKDERQFLGGWLARCAEADYVCVLDTGSTDGTWEALLERQGEQLRVAQKVFTPWRFDAARNESLKLVPLDTDVCVCLDLDELPEEGWRRKLEQHWSKTATCGRYDYIWNFRPDGSDGVRFLGEKIHAYGAVRWHSPVHEYPVFTRREDCRLPIRVEHHADASKSRSSYLPLLELAVQEEPENDRNMHYLGREYMFHGRYREAIETLERHLRMPTATWDAERAASMRYIARCWRYLGDDDTAELWLYRAWMEDRGRREAMVDLAQLFYEQKRWKSCLAAAETALGVQTRDESYLTEPEAWGAKPWDLAGIAAWNIGEKDKALYYAREAAKLEPGDERLRKNVEIMEGQV